jgi:hypothetical protein
MPPRFRITSLLVPCLLVLATAAPVRAQQQASDPAFNTKIARPAFTTRHPILLVDQGHNNTHTTRARYDVLAHLATSDGFEVAIDDNVFDRRDLKEAAVLVIANGMGGEDMRRPTAANSAFTPAECTEVYRWVEAGGSLLFIAEHWPMGHAALPMAERFGIDFSTGYLADPALADTTFGASTLVFSDATGTLGDHPIMRGRVPAERVKRIRTYTGQSMVGPAGSVALLKVTPRAQDFMLGAKGVNGAIPDSLKRSAAGRAQAIAFTVGKGRVVVLGEATMLAAQLVPGPGGAMRKVGMNSPGFDNRQFALNVLRWLGRAIN